MRKSGVHLGSDLVVATVADHILPETSQRTLPSHAYGAYGVSVSRAVTRFKAVGPVEP